MKIEFTEIKKKHINTDNVTAKKIILAEKIVSFFIPLFNEEIEKKRKELEVLKQTKLKLKLKIVETNKSIKLIDDSLKIEKVKNEILNQISSMKINDIKSKQLILNLLQRLDKLSLKELDEILVQVMKYKPTKKD